jgi:hypothetical protein
MSKLLDAAALKVKNAPSGFKNIRVNRLKI